MPSGPLPPLMGGPEERLAEVAEAYKGKRAEGAAVGDRIAGPHHDGEGAGAAGHKYPFLECRLEPGKGHLTSPLGEDRLAGVEAEVQGAGSQVGLVPVGRYVVDGRAVAPQDGTRTLHRGRGPHHLAGVIDVQRAEAVGGDGYGRAVGPGGEGHHMSAIAILAMPEDWTVATRQRATEGKKIKTPARRRGLSLPPPCGPSLPRGSPTSPGRRVAPGKNRWICRKLAGPP